MAVRARLQARALPGRAFPPALLQELLAVVTGWLPDDRASAHKVFGAVLPAAGDGLADAQTHSVLSALWHEVLADLPAATLSTAASLAS